MRIFKRISKWFGLALVGVFCGAISASAAVKQGTAVVKALHGSASYVDELGFNHPLAIGTVVKQGQTVKTAPNSSVDLFLAENGPGVALEEDSMLTLDRLSSMQSVLGTLIDTRLDLRQGKMYGTVDKLLPGSHYEVKTPTGVATVRGTEFFIDTRSGTVFVTSGTVNVTVTLLLKSGPISRTIAVTAGHELTIPQVFHNVSDFNSLAQTSTPPGLNQTTLRRLAQLGLLTRYTSLSSVSSATETFEAEQLKNGQIKVEKPPESIEVSK